MDEKDIRLDVVNDFIRNTLIELGVAPHLASLVKLLFMSLFVVAMVFLLRLVVNRLLTFVFKKMAATTPLTIFGYAMKNKLPYYLTLIVPYTFVRTSIPFVFEGYRSFISPMLKLIDVYLVLLVIWASMSVLRSLMNVLQERPDFKQKSFTSYLQVIQIVFYIFGLVVVYSIITGNSVTTFFAAMGAASAVLMLMFQDSIKGFVASIQVSSNDMVRVGDWITMSKFGADGTVKEINLTTIKIKNFDNTITTLPTYSLISDSFQNWRGIQDLGARRFTRSLCLNQADIRPLNSSDLDKMKQVDGLQIFLTENASQLEFVASKSEAWDVLNKHRPTNNDAFMAYATWYLNQHPSLRKDLSIVVRQLPPTAEGLPVQLYAFTATIESGEYESAISEVMNHLISIMPLFELRIYSITMPDRYNVHLEKI